MLNLIFVTKIKGTELDYGNHIECLVSEQSQC